MVCLGAVAVGLAVFGHFGYQKGFQLYQIIKNSQQFISSTVSALILVLFFEFVESFVMAITTRW